MAWVPPGMNLKMIGKRRKQKEKKEERSRTLRTVFEITFWSLCSIQGYLTN